MEVFSWLQNAAALAFDDDDTLMLDASIGIEQSGPNGSSSWVCKGIQQLIENVGGEKLNVVVEKQEVVAVAGFSGKVVQSRKVKRLVNSQAVDVGTLGDLLNPHLGAIFFATIVN